MQKCASAFLFSGVMQRADRGGDGAVWRGVDTGGAYIDRAGRRVYGNCNGTVRQGVEYRENRNGVGAVCACLRTVSGLYRKRDRIFEENVCARAEKCLKENHCFSIMS